VDTRLPDTLEGKPALGTIRLSFQLPAPVELTGASYKMVKTLAIRGCPGENPWSLPEKAYARMSPLLDPRGRPILAWRRGWTSTPWRPQPRILEGPVGVELGWYGPGARFAEKVANCLARSVRDLSIERLEIDPLADTPATKARIRLVTPAQVKFHGHILPCPPAWRLLRRPLEQAGADQRILEEIAMLLESIEARLEQVTVYFDEERPTNWAVTGRLTILLSPHAQEHHKTILGRALQIAHHTGVGKSRLEGLGWTQTQKIW